MRILGLAMALLFYSANAAQAYGQTTDSHPDSDDAPDCSSPHSGFLGIASDKQGFADEFIELCADPAREPELRHELPTALGCQAGQAGFSVFKNEELNAFEVTCRIAMPRRTLQFSGQTDLLPIQTILKNANVRVLTVSVWLPRYGPAHCDPPTKDYDLTPEGREYTYVLKGDSADPNLIRYSFGYDATQLARIILSLGLLLVIPVVLTLWFRRRALSVPEESKSGIVFAYRRFLTWTLLGGALFWWTAVDLLHADDLVALLITSRNSNGSGIETTLAWILLWLFPAFVYFVCLTLSSPIQSLRGLERTPREAVRQSFWTVARFVLPVSLIVLGISELFIAPRVGILLIGASVVAGRVIQRKLQDVLGTELHALTSGELRDRAFAIAHNAGAKLNQLYIFPAERMRMANAFAHSANNIFLTDYLLQNLNKREVDAVIGHEVAHLQKRHIRMRFLVLFGGVAVVAFATGWSEQWIPSGFPAGPVAYGCLLLVLFVVSRHNEFAADAGAVKLTGDAEAMMTALARISRLNTMPLHWGKFDEKILTHPSTLRRITRLAHTAGLSEARIPELLTESAAPPSDLYPIPATALPAGKIFSTRFKVGLGARIAWSMIFTSAALATIVALAVQSTPLFGSARSIVYLAGLFLTLGISLILVNYLPLMGTSRLRIRLREKLQREKAPPEICNGLFVCLSPDSGPRIYETNWGWDIAFIALSGDCLYYRGEEARFTLHRDQIEHISLGPGPVGWFDTPSVYVTWRDAAGNNSVFNLRSPGERSMLQMARDTRRLADELEKWHRGVELPPGSLLAAEKTELCATDSYGVPHFGRVTSISPRNLARAPNLIRIFMFDTLLALGVAILFGLRFPMLDSIASSSNVSVLEPNGGSVVYVLAVVWLTRAFFLWHYWRFRETPLQPVHPAPTPAPGT